MRAATRPSAVLRVRRRPTVLIVALGLAQIVSWGSTFYAFPVFVLPMTGTFGWSLTLLNGAATGGLLVTAACAYAVGAIIDRYGGRAIMTCGSLGVCVLLVAWSQITQPLALYAVWLGLGACMAAVLYEPAFAVLTQHFGPTARRAITSLTLIAGFASTVFVPLIETLLGVLAWRDVLLVLAGLNACICVPIHLLFVPPRPAPAACTPEMSAGRAPAHPVPAPADDDGRAVLRARLRNPVFWGLTVWFTAWTAGLSGLVFQLVPYLKSSGVETGALLVTVALIGPMQVVGRGVMMLCGERARISTTGAVTTTLSCVAVLLLLVSPPELRWLIPFAVAFGVTNGVTTIMRGVAPAEWLGRAHYGKVMGAMGAPMMVASAVAPLASAAIWTATGNPAWMLGTLLGVALTGAAGFWFAAARSPLR